MVLNMLKTIGCGSISVAGFDGIKNGKGSFYIDSLSRIDRNYYYSEEVLAVLKSHYSDMNIRFLTGSYYENYNI